VNIVVTAKVGGGGDLFAHALADAAVGVLAQPITVENQPGDSGTLAASVVAQRAADGYTLLFANPGSIIFGPIIQKRPERKWDAFDPVARIHGEEEFLFVRADSPWKTIDDVVAAARANPGSVKVAGSTAGSTDQFVVLLLQKAAGVTFTYVPFDGGGPARTSFEAGDEDVLIGNYSDAGADVAAGKIRAVAVASEARSAIADVPTLKEKGWNVVLFQWRGLMVPKGTSAARIRVLADNLKASMASASWAAYRASSKSIDLFLDPTEFRTYLESEEQRFAPIIAELGL
jgi:tripartite-type tricarboxylate transporter receptor subunit TctC